MVILLNDLEETIFFDERINDAVVPNLFPKRGE